jgi:hypothetical protein
VRLEEAAARLDKFSANSSLTARVGSLERDLQGLDAQGIVPLLPGLHIDRSLLEATLQLKDVAGQINVVLHAIGILWSLPYVLEHGEVVEKLSLGVGNAPERHWDLETDRQIGEFTFIRWRGGPEPVRKQKVFANLVALALADTPKRRVLYVVGKERPLAFLRGRSDLSATPNCGLVSMRRSKGFRPWGNSSLRWGR